MAIKLTDARFILILNAAMQRNDRRLIAPEALKEGAKRKFAAKLLAAGLVREIKVKSEGPVWRHAVEAGQAFGLKLTSAGVKAIAVNGPTEPETQQRGHESIATSAPPAPAPKPQASPPPPSQIDAPISESPAAADAAHQPQPSTASLAPRKGTKLAQVIDLLERKEGATIAELIAVTAWLPHTTRAARTGARKRGYQVTIDRFDKVRSFAYRITVSEAKERDGRRNGDEAPVAAEQPNAEAAKPRRARRTASGDAHRRLDELLRHPTSSLVSIAQREVKSERSIRQSLSLAFLNPSLAKAAIEGRLPRGFGVKRLIDLPMLWSEQWAALGLRAPASDR